MRLDLNNSHGPAANRTRHSENGLGRPVQIQHVLIPHAADAPWLFERPSALWNLVGGRTAIDAPGRLPFRETDDLIKIAQVAEYIVP
jgi:hypothetical protein